MKKEIYEHFNDDIVENAASLYGLEASDLKKLGGFESFVYSFEKDQKEYILRITHSMRRTLEHIESEMDWIAFLHNNGVSCSLPFKTMNGQLAGSVGQTEAPFIVCAFDKMKGSHLKKETDTPEFRFHYGKLLGKMHRLTKDYQPQKAKRILWYQDELVKHFEEIIPADQTLVKNQFQNLKDKISQIKTDRNNFGLVHFDAHAGNFFVENNELHIFDFDDSQYAHFIADIAIVLFYFSFHIPPEMDKNEIMQRFFKEFMTGYQTENTLSAEEYKYIPDFLKMREFMLYAAIYNAFQDGDFDGWARHYMTGRKESLENNLPFLDLSFKA